MAELVLAISPDYEKEKHDLQWILREFTANGNDAVARGEGTFKVTYYPRSMTIQLATYGVKLEHATLLMGTSDSRQHEDCVGMFGEGLPTSIKAGADAKREGRIKDIRFYNDDEKWNVSIEHDDTWGAEVVKVRTRRIQSRCGFIVEIEGVSQEAMDLYKKTFLYQDESFDKEQVVKPCSYKYGRILLQDEFAGRLYVKGVFIKAIPELTYGYDVDMELGRDRDLVDTWNLRWKLQDLLQAAVAKDPARFKAAFLDGIESGEALEFASPGSFAYNKKVIEVVTEGFHEKYGEDTVPVTNMTEARECAAVGLRSAVVSSAMKELIEKQDGLVDARKKRASMKSERTWAWHDLTPAERNTFLEVTVLINQHSTLVKGDEDVGSLISIVDFTNPKLLGRYDTGVTTPIRIARKIVGDWKQFLTTVVHEMCHGIPGCDHSELNNDNHERAMEEELVCIIAGMYQGDERNHNPILN